jgi:DNA-binding Xre family transcriptional regulator
MTLDEAKQLTNTTSNRQLAAVLGITKQAVSAWGDVVPEAQSNKIELMVLKRKKARKEKAHAVAS